MRPPGSGGGCAGDGVGVPMFALFDNPGVNLIATVNQSLVVESAHDRAVVFLPFSAAFCVAMTA